MNGYRLTIAGLALLAASWACNAPIAVGAPTLAIYALVACLAIAVPQALLFVALRRDDVSETMAAFLEGCIPGLVFIFLLAADPYASSLLTTISVVFALVGLAIFLGVRPGAGTVRIGAGEKMVLLSAVFTAAGMVVAGLLLPAAGTQTADKLRQSLANTAWTALLAGIGTLLHARFVARVPWTVPDRQTVPYILGLALIGTCIGWGSFFVLLREDVLVAATSDVAVPVAVALVSWVAFGKRMTRHQCVGAIVIVAALTLLIAVKL